METSSCPTCGNCNRTSREFHNCAVCFYRVTRWPCTWLGVSPSSWTYHHPVRFEPSALVAFWNQREDVTICDYCYCQRCHRSLAAIGGRKCSCGKTDKRVNHEPI